MGRILSRFLKSGARIRFFRSYGVTFRDNILFKKLCTTMHLLHFGTFSSFFSTMLGAFLFFNLVTTSCTFSMEMVLVLVGSLFCYSWLVLYWRVSLCKAIKFFEISFSLKWFNFVVTQVVWYSLVSSIFSFVVRTVRALFRLRILAYPVCIRLVLIVCCSIRSVLQVGFPYFFS